MAERWNSPTRQIGNALDYLDAQVKQEHERDYYLAERGYEVCLNEDTKEVLRQEALFYKDIKQTNAMKAAVDAFERTMKKGKRI